MKRFSLLMTVLMLAGAAFGQKPIKVKLNKVETMIKNNEIAEAKEMIDAGLTYEKTMNDPQTYLLRGIIYAIIDTTMAGLADNPMETALASFAKSDELNADSEKELFTTDASGFPVTKSQHINKYWAYYFNIGAAAYGDEDYETAVEGFTKSQMILPEDTNGYVNAGLSAQNLEDYQTAKKNYYKGIELGAREKDIWNLLIYIVGTIDDNKEEALRLTRQIKEVYPDDSDIARSEISLLIGLGQVKPAIENLNKRIEAEPNDPQLHFTMGVLNEEIALTIEDPEAREAQNKKAMDAYLKAIEIDQDHYDSHYNIGVMLINHANIVIKESNNLGVSREDLKKADELAPIIQERLKVALERWEKAREIKEEVPALETLHYLYTQLKMYDQAEEVKARIDELGGSEG